MIFKIYSKKAEITTKYKVYFEPDLGKILSVTNKDVDEYKNYFELPLQEVEDFLTGVKNIVNYKVIFDIKEQSYKIVNKNQPLIVYADDLIFKVPNITGYQILVEQNLKDNKWKISAENSLKEKMKEITSRLEEIMFFSITQSNNPNILYNHFYVSIKDVIENDTVEFNFTSQDEAVAGLTSVYTNKKFDRYTHEVIDV